MSKRKFLYFLADSKGRIYKVKGGIVTNSAERIPLKYAPSGWQEQSIKWVRNQAYHGLIPSYSIPLRFIKESAQIIRNQIYKNGIEDELFVIVFKLNKLTGKHEGYFKGEINFAKYSDTQNFFETNVTETGFYKMLKAYENTAFDIPMINAVDLEMDGLALQKKSNFAVVDGYTFDGLYTVGLAYVNEEGTSFGYVTGNSPFNNLVGWGGAATNDDRWILKNVSDAPITFMIKGEMKFRMNTIPQSWGCRIELSSAPGIPAAVLVPKQTWPTSDTTYIVDTTLTIPAGARAFIIGDKLPEYSVSQIGIQHYQSTISFITQTRFKTTTIKIVNAADIADALVKKIAGNDYSVDSNLLRNCGIYLTCGDAIRGIANAVLKTSFKDYYNSFNRNLCIAMDVVGKVVKIFPRINAYSGSIIYNLGEAVDGSFSLKEQWLGSSIKVGYPNQEYDDVNGKDEFNNTAIYKTPLSRVTTEIDLTAKYRADPYGIEFIRINLEGKTTTDNKGDTDIFMIDVVNDSGTFRLNRPAYSSISGVLNTNTIFNTELSPAKILLKHESWFRSIFWKQESNKLTHETSEKNALLSTTLNGKTVSENADILIGSLQNPYFYPIEFKGKFVVPDNLQSIINTNYGKFEFTWLGNTWRGFLMEASQKPSGNEEQEFTLLLSIDNDLTKLIHG